MNKKGLLIFLSIVTFSSFVACDSSNSVSSSIFSSNMTSTSPNASNSVSTSIFSSFVSSDSSNVQSSSVTSTSQESNNSISTNVDKGNAPVVSKDNLSVEYGLYPQSNVKDATLIATLNALTPLSNGWCYYNGEYYVKEVAKVYNNESYIFDSGDAIVDGKDYWFKCEPIKWNVLKSDNGKYVLLSSKLLDVQSFYKNYEDRSINNEIIHANNYYHSDVRNWLNDYFYNTAFLLNNDYVLEVDIDNSSTSTDDENNKYVCSNSQDKVYLPSYQDYLNTLNSASSRECKTTDYARVRGAWCNTTLNYNSSYWTRSPSSEYYYCAWNVNSGGYLSSYAVDGDDHCVRPCININLG